MAKFHASSSLPLSRIGRCGQARTSHYDLRDLDHSAMTAAKSTCRHVGQNAKLELSQMTYTADGDEGDFTVPWNRTAVTTPAPEQPRSDWFLLLGCL
jgi:hypothetical protein